MVANQAVEDYCFSKILMYIPDLKTDTDRLSDAIELLRNHRYRILNNQSLEASRSMGINWIAVINLYNEQLKTVQNILARAMLNNIDDFRRNANILIGITMSALVFIALVEPFLFWANINKTYSLVKVQTKNTIQLTKLTEVLCREKKRSDDLIYKLVPADIAKKLKNHIAVTPEIFDSVSVLYADIVNFTLISSYHSATEVVNLLNYLFCLIDKLTDKYEAFKADTVGDAYVAVTGLPTCGSKATSESVTNIAHLALEMLGQLNNLDHENESMCEVKLRIGLATGPVSVGMIGMKIPKYCVFGETVNLATAMEERSQAMRILITKYTRNFLADTGIFETLFRGQFKIDDTIVDTYWLVGSSCIDKGLDIFNSNQNKKGGGVLNKRIKQKQMDQVPPPYEDATPMVPVVSGVETQPQGKDRLTTVLGSAVIGGEKEIPVSET
ncbi:atrial natriuretic peptide receptor 2-like [Bolinopsis microptera]|uniref:atrial natriuretic peptide receptor 2-like n=1 Tax=Bolinopsis microptera TaxID=2820187 RepID=UPI00307A6238